MRKLVILFLIGLAYSQWIYSQTYSLGINESVTISQTAYSGYIDNVGLADFLDPHLSFKKNYDGTATITVISYFDYTAKVSLAFLERYQSYYSGRYHTRAQMHYKTVNIKCNSSKPAAGKKVKKVYLPEKVRIFINAEERTYIYPIYEPTDATPNSSSWQFDVGTGSFSHHAVSDGSCWLRGNSIGVGKASVTIDGDKNLYASTIIEVADPDHLPPTSVFLPSSIEISVGGSATLAPILVPDNTATTYTWTSKDPKVASVSYGKVTGNKVGTTTIQLKTANELTATCEVTVVATNGKDDEENGDGNSFTGTVDGHEYVDLGLSVKWAICNVGASKAEDFGNYYAWGETSTKSTYSWDTYLYGNYMSETYIGSDIKGTKYDVANTKWGSNWRMPTEKEFRELTSNCQISRTKKNNVDGYEITGKNGASIFIPVAGYKDAKGFQEGFTYYWTSNYSSGDPGFATYGQISYNKSKNTINPSVSTRARMLGFPVRPVTTASGSSDKQQIQLSASPSGGEVQKGSKVYLSTDISGSDIYYTLNGYTPSKNSTKYTSSGITINEACTLKAIAYKDGYDTSDILTASYTIKSSTIEPTSITVSPSSKTIKVGDTFTVSYSLTPSNASTTVSWSSDDSSIATVSSSGLVKGVKAGSTYINATTSNGKTAWCSLKVETKSSSESVTINSTNFPDANFRNYLLEKDYGKDGVISGEEIDKLTYLNLSNKEISSLKGIEKLTALKSLYCSSNKLTSIDISKNTLLETLNCGDNQISSLSVSNNPALEYLACNENQISSLDVSRLTALKSLYCYRNQLTSLSVSNNPALEILNCSGNQISSLDVSRLTALKNLSCGDNQLSSLSVSNNTALEYLSCYENQISSLDVSRLTALKSLSCYRNQLTSLSVSNNTALESLYCYENQISSLDVSRLTALESLYCYKNQLTSLSVSNNPALEYLACNENQISSLDVSRLTALKSLSCYKNQLTSLSVSNNIALEYLSCEDNQISSLDVSRLTNLKSLYCYKNQLTSLSVSNNPALEYLSCYENQISALDVSRLTALKSLYCYKNQLTSLSISNNTALEYLSCYENQISALDVSRLTALESLSCSENQITSLDVSRLTALKSLYCQKNQITSLDISRLTSLKSLYCYTNQLTSLSVSNNTVLETLSCEDNQISSLDVSRLTNLKSLYCYKNQLTSLSVSNNTALEYLSCNENQISSLDVSRLTVLKSLSCYKNQLTSLSVSNNTALETLNCGDNQILSLDVSRLTNLKSLYCYKNQLTSLSVSNNTALESLNCGDNQISSLDISRLTALKSLYCYTNQLTSLSVSNNTALESLSCGDNQISSLDITKNIVLKSLSCYANQISYLDISKNKSLTEVRIYRNQITGTNMEFLISNLPTNHGDTNNGFYVINMVSNDEKNVCTPIQVSSVKAKGWIPYYWDITEKKWLEYTGDNASGIKNIMEEEEKDAPIFDLSGKRISQPRKGIFIIRGKKVVVNRF